MESMPLVAGENVEPRKLGGLGDLERSIFRDLSRSLDRLRDRERDRDLDLLRPSRSRLHAVDFRRGDGDLDLELLAGDLFSGVLLFDL